MFAAVAPSGKNHRFHIGLCHLALSVLSSAVNPSTAADTNASYTEGTP